MVRPVDLQQILTQPNSMERVQQSQQQHPDMQQRGDRSDHWPEQDAERALNIRISGVFRFYLSVKTTDIVSGGEWERRPQTLSEPTMLVNNVLE